MDWLFLALNILVSAFTARQTGEMWATSQVAGGGTKLIAYGGALQAVCGLVVAVPTMLYQAAMVLHLVPHELQDYGFVLDGLNQVLPITGTAAVIMIEAWRTYFKDKTVASMDAASTATLDALHRMYASLPALAAAFGSFSLHFTAPDSGGTETQPTRATGQLVALGLLIVASGYFIARGILMYYAKQEGRAYVIDKRIQQAVSQA